MDISDKIHELSEAVRVISEVQKQEIPEDLEESLKSTELLLRGYIHLLEETLTYGH